MNAIESGQAWIQAATAEQFQPQELRLHQREGIHYDKGCYLGQEVIARLWFKAKPKHWLHLVQGTGEAPAIASKLNNDVEVVNSVNIDGGFKALVVAKPEALIELGLTVLDLLKHSVVMSLVHNKENHFKKSPIWRGFFKLNHGTICSCL